MTSVKKGGITVVVGAALGAPLVALAGQRWGRKRVFIGGSMLAITGALCAAVSIEFSSFSGFVLSSTLLGVAIAVAQQYRFAAMECVTAELVPQAASRVLLGGLFAAFLGPELAVQGKSLFNTPYLGSLLLLA
ncbi:MAG: MFS transporter, partial [Oceanicoccus sp.]|nr:MFS transporter [Oceanicoccus sp.]